jgi:hypothetical protein
MDVTTDWFWEGNVVAAIARHLEGEGWEIVGQADTRLKERGVFTGSGKTERFGQSARTGATDLSGPGNLAAIRLSPSGTEN